MQELKHKVAIVTGGAAGFGADIARAYIKAGAHVLIADLDAEKGQELLAELGTNGHFFPCDVSQGEQVHALVEHCVKLLGVPNIVVNNAGTTHKNQDLLDIDEESFDRVYAVNVKSIYHMTQAVVPLMRIRKSGVILNIGSTAGLRPRPGLSWYNGSKGAVNVLSQSLAVELGPDQIRVNAICPVMGETGLLEKFMGMPDTPENRSKFLATIPLGRLCRGEDVAAAALYLASDAAQFISGICLPVDGARTV